jgi:hypothetical protein
MKSIDIIYRTMQQIKSNNMIMSHAVSAHIERDDRYTAWITADKGITAWQNPN